MLETLIHLFARYGYAVIFAGVLLENAGIPAPGHTVVLAGAFLAQSGKLTIGWVFAVACAAAILGDNAGYWLGRAGARKFIHRHRKLLHLSAEREKWAIGFFERHGAKTVFIARFVPGLQTVGALLAGMGRMHWPRFLLWNTLGALAWAATYCAFGYLFGASWDELQKLVGHAGLLMLALVAAIVLLAILHRKRAVIGGWLEKYLPPGLSPRALLLIVLSLGAAGIFAKVAEGVIMSESSAFDHRVNHLAQRLQSPPLEAVMRVVTWLGSWPVVMALAAIATLWCLLRRDRLGAAVTAGVALGSAGLDLVLKQIFERARPVLFHEIPLPASYAFPSGHAMVSAASYGIIAYVVTRRLPRAKWLPFAVAALLVLLIGASRVFLGVHWATDVLAGFAGGAFCLMVGAVLLELSAARPAPGGREDRGCDTGPAEPGAPAARRRESHR